MSKYFWVYTPSRNARLAPELYANPGQACFFTVRAWGRSAPFGEERYARIAIDCLLGQRAKSGCQVEVYCLVPDHLHVVITPSAGGSSSLTFIDRFKGWSSRGLHQAGWQDKVWQPGGYDHLIREDDDLEAIGVYILGNPIRKGLAAIVEEYLWSGIPEPIVFPL